MSIKKLFWVNYFSKFLKFDIFFFFIDLFGNHFYGTSSVKTYYCQRGGTLKSLITQIKVSTSVEKPFLFSVLYYMHYSICFTCKYYIVFFSIMYLNFKEIK